MNAQEWLDEFGVNGSVITSREAEAYKIITALLADNARWKKAIEGLTPSGSEFVDDPENCAAYIRRMTQWPKQIAELKKDNAALRARCEAARAEAFRECAEIAEKYCEYHQCTFKHSQAIAAEKIAAAIREKGKVCTTHS